MKKYLILSIEERLVMYVVDTYEQLYNGGIRLSPKFQIAPNVCVVEQVEENAIPSDLGEKQYKYINGEFIEIIPENEIENSEG